jgi:hypothetical protein
MKTAADDVQAGIVDRVKTVARKFHLENIRATGPATFFNPTNIRMQIRYRSEDLNGGQRNSLAPETAQEASLVWRARDNRKGRNSIAVPREALDEDENASFLPVRYTPSMSVSFKEIGRTIYAMATTFPYWDMAFWSGSSYTIGSALFVVDGVLAWGPQAYGEGWISADTEKYVGPLCFFIGALFYQVGAVAAYLEAVNDGCFHGSAMRKLLEGHDDQSKELLDYKIRDFFRHMKPHKPHQKNDTALVVDPEAGWNTKDDEKVRPGSIYPEDQRPGPRRGGVDFGSEEGKASVYNTWRWWPTWKALREYHLYDIGYVACTIQLLGVTLYGVTAIVVLPGILSSLQPWQKLAAFWVPQVVAALCFLISSTLFLLETQEKWWKPEPKVLGWWIGVWSIAGSVGFELIACWGIKALHSGKTAHWASYQSDLATLWGSGCYMVGSALQWYEALNKSPVEELFSEEAKGEIWMDRRTPA